MRRLSDWYHDRATECDRLATNAAGRARHIADRDSWLEIAAGIDAAEEVVKQRKG
jgi:hypothetical protein